MVAKSILSLTIGFGAITIPVRIFKAVEDGGPSFHQYHRDDKGAVRYQRVCSTCGRTLGLEDIEKGKKFGNDIIMFEDADLDRMKPESSKIMRILGFYDPDLIPQIALSEPFYVGTETKKRGGLGSPFKLFREALKKSARVALVAWVSRGHDHYGVLSPYGDILLLRELDLASDIRADSEVEVLPGQVRPQLVEKTVTGIIARMTKKKFDWESLKDGYAETLDKYIEAKALGEPITIEEVLPKTPSELRDLESLVDQTAAALER